MPTKNWNEVSAFSIYRQLSRPTVFCTFFYGCAIYCVGEFSHLPVGSELDIALLLVATSLMGYMGWRLGRVLLEDTVSPFFRLLELGLSLPAFWVSLAYIFAIYKGEISFKDMPLPYLDTLIWPWFLAIFASSFLVSRVVEPKIDEYLTKKVGV